MKIRVCITLDIDTEAWATDYGIEPTAAAIRKDVQEYAHTALTQGMPHQINPV